MIHLINIILAVFLGYNQYWPGGFMGLCFLCPGTPEGSTSCGSGLKRLRRRGHGLKSYPTGWEKPVIEPATPGLQDIGLFSTPRRLHLIKCPLRNQQVDK